MENKEAKNVLYILISSILISLVYIIYFFCWCSNGFKTLKSSDKL